MKSPNRDFSISFDINGLELTKIRIPNFLQAFSKHFLGPVVRYQWFRFEKAWKCAFYELHLCHCPCHCERSEATQAS